MNSALERFRSEITNFYLISLTNLVFAALSMAFGIAYMIGAVTGISAEPQIPLFRLLAGAAAMICFGLGITWLLMTVRIFEGVGSIRDVLCAHREQIPSERVTCLIVQMLAHYRDNRDTIRTMILVSTAGGCVFFILSVATGIRALSLTMNGGSATFDSLSLVPSMILSLGVAIVSLVSSHYFSGFAELWDERLGEIDASECTLKDKLGLDEQ